MRPTRRAAFSPNPPCKSPALSAQEPVQLQIHRNAGTQIFNSSRRVLPADTLPTDDPTRPSIAQIHSHSSFSVFINFFCGDPLPAELSLLEGSASRRWSAGEGRGAGRAGKRRGGVRVQLRLSRAGEGETVEASSDEKALEYCGLGAEGRTTAIWQLLGFSWLIYSFIPIFPQLPPSQINSPPQDPTHSPIPGETRSAHCRLPSLGPIKGREEMVCLNYRGCRLGQAK